MLTAARSGVQVCAASAGDLSARIGDAERLNGWAS
jgi:hypothetical protein